MMNKKPSGKSTPNLYTLTDTWEIELSRIGVIIPAYQAQDLIGSVIASLEKLGFPKSSIIVVDDGSTDRTFEVAQSFGVVVLRHKKNCGKGAALKTGFEKAVASGFEAVITLDADNQHLVLEIDKFVEKYSKDESDLILGHRLTNTKGMPYVRILVNRTTSLVVSILVGGRIPDSQCGFRLIRTSLLEKIQLKTNHFETESELVIRAGLRHYKIASVPITTVYTDGHSHINPIIDTLRFILMALKFLWR